MYVSLFQKVVASVIGVLFVLLLLVIGSWWFAILGLVAIAPFFTKILTA